MKTPNCLLTALLFIAWTGSNLPAATFYLQADMGNNTTGNNINNTANYWDSPTTGGSHPSAMAGNDFSNNGFFMRISPGSTANSVLFQGNSLILTGGAAGLRVNGGTATVATIDSLGGTSISDGTNGTLSVASFTLSGNTTFDTSGAGGTVFKLDFTTLSGSGDLLLNSTASGTDGRYIQLSVGTGTGFTGDILWDGLNGKRPVLQFGNDLVLDGGLVAEDTYSRILLDRNVTFSSLSLNGGNLAAGTYSYSYLNTNYGTIFLAGGSGSITVVPEPSTAVLLTLGGSLLLVLRRRSLFAADHE